MGLGELGEDKRWGEVRRMKKKDRRKEKKERTRKELGTGCGNRST